MRQEYIEVPNENISEVTAELQFGTPIYSVKRKDFLQSVKKISSRLLNEAKQKPEYNSENPLAMTENFFNDPQAQDFCDFIGKTSWDILSDQGYAMDGMSVHFAELWTQEHKKHSLMEQHTHRFGSQIVGFYFLDVPDPAPHALFYDPRIAAVQGGMPERDTTQLTLASSIISKIPEAGSFIFTNSWLAHSFSKNLTDKPFRFVHFNMFVAPNQSSNHKPMEVEVI